VDNHVNSLGCEVLEIFVAVKDDVFALLGSLDQAQSGYNQAHILKISIDSKNADAYMIQVRNPILSASLIACVNQMKIRPRG